MASIFLQFYKHDKLIMRINPLTYDKNKGIIVDMNISNLGNASGMVRLNRFMVMNTNTKGYTLSPNKEIIVKPGDIENLKYTTNYDPFNVISNSNKIHDIRLHMSYVNSAAHLKASEFNIGYICMSSNYIKVHTDSITIPLDKFEEERGNSVLFDGYNLKVLGE